MKISKKLFLGVAVCLVSGSLAQAAQLILPPPSQTQYDLNDANLDVVYNATSQILGVTNVNGFYSALQVNNADDASFYETSSYLTATINSAGVIASGAFDLFGDNNGGSGPDGILLSGTLQSSGASGVTWGYDNNNIDDQFSFLFTVTGGTLASDFGGVGATAGVQLFAEFTSVTGDHPFSGTWGNSFNNLTSGNVRGSGVGYDDVYLVPEPSSAMLLLLAFPLFLLTRFFLRRSAPISAQSNHPHLRSH